MRDLSAKERFGNWRNVIVYDEDFFEEEHPDLDDDQRWEIFIEDAKESYDYDIPRMMKELKWLNHELRFYQLDVDGNYGDGFYVNFTEEPYSTDPESLCKEVFGRDEKPTRSRIARAVKMHEDECDKIARFLERSTDYGFYPSNPESFPYKGDNGLSAFFSKSRKRSTARRKASRRTVSRAGKPMRAADGYRLYMMRGDGARARIHLAGPEPGSSEEAFARFRSQYPLTYRRTNEPDCKGYHIWTRENGEWEDRTDFYEDEPLYFWLVSDSSLRSRSARRNTASKNTSRHGGTMRKTASPKRRGAGARR